MTDDMAAKVLELREEGKGIAEIARALKKGNAYVTEVLKAHGSYGRPYYLTDDEKDQVRKLRLEGNSAEVIADSLGRSKYAIIECLRKLKLNKRQLRTIEIKGDVAYIPLTRGKVCIIDAADAALFAGRSCFAMNPNPGSGRWYAATRENGKPVTIHRILMGDTGGLYVDHVNGDGLDNRRENLRLATPQQNAANTRREIGGSGFTGVRAHKSGKFYAAVQINLGTFNTAEEAARAYDAKVIELFGEFATTNASLGLLPEEVDMD